jgi:anti-sigma B factor antagonist
MVIWILRFAHPRQKPSDERQLLVLQRDDEGNLADIDSLAITGRHMNLPEAVETQVRLGRTRLVLDLVHEKHIDSNDMAQIIGAMKYAKDAGGELVFANPNARLRELFRITHLEDVMALYDSIGAAARHFLLTD